MPPNQNTSGNVLQEVKATIYKPIIILLIITVGLFLMFFAFTIHAIFLKTPSAVSTSYNYSLWDNAVGSLFFTFITLLFVLMFWRLPVRTHLSQGTLTSYNFLFIKRQIELQQVQTVKPTILFAFPRGGGVIDGLKLVNQNGKSVIIHLGSLPRAKRRLFFEPVGKLLPQTSDGSNNRVSTAWNKWFAFIKESST